MSDADVPSIIVVGGGITGLSAAHRMGELARQQGRRLNLALLEASDRLGGVIWTVRRNGFLIEAGPDQFVTNKPWAMALTRRLGIESQLLATRQAHRRVMVVRRGQLLPIPEGFLLLAPTRVMPMVTTRLMSWFGKMRMAMELVVPAKRNGADADQSVAAFVRRRFGREALDRLVEPLLGSIYGVHLDQLSLRATLPRFLELEQRHGSLIRAMRHQAKTQNSAPPTGGVRYGMFVTFKDGLSTLVETLADCLSDVCRLNCRVAGIRRAEPGREGKPWRVDLNDGQAIEADGVIVAGPVPQTASILRGLDDVLTDQLNGITYGATTVVHCAYRREQVAHALDAFGFVVPIAERRAITAASFSSVKYEGRAPENLVLLRAVGGQTLLQDRDDVVADAVHQDLVRLLKIRGRPSLTTVHRYPEVMAKYDVGHLERVGAIRQRLTRYRGLLLAGNGYDGVGIPDCIHCGEVAAEQMLQTLWC